jgi:hypothetical protein
VAVWDILKYDLRTFQYIISVACRPVPLKKEPRRSFPLPLRIFKYIISVAREPVPLKKEPRRSFPLGLLLYRFHI